MEYDKNITAKKGMSGAAQYGSAGVLIGVAFYLLRANLPGLKLWPVEMDAAVVGALTGVLSGAIRAALNWHKHA